MLCSENVPRLQDFSARFSSRFAELMFDVDEVVAAASLRLQALLVRHKVLKHKVGGGRVLEVMMAGCPLDAFCDSGWMPLAHAPTAMAVPGVSGCVRLLLSWLLLLLQLFC
jgi:hypothetical protein